MQDVYAKYVKEHFVRNDSSAVHTYNQKYLKMTALTEDSSSRLWWFQVCTEVAYFQVAPKNDSIRSSKVDTKYVSGNLILFRCFFIYANLPHFAIV